MTKKMLPPKRGYFFISLLLIVFTSFFYGWTEQTFAEEKPSVLDEVLVHFFWHPVKDEDVAVSYPETNFVYKIDIHHGDLAFLSEEVRLIDHVSALAGLTVKNVEELSPDNAGRFVRIWAIMDPDFKETVRREADSFIRAGIPPFHVANLAKAPQNFVCEVNSFRDEYDPTSISASYVLAKQLKLSCLRRATYAAFGVSNIDDHLYEDLALCVLYESRRRGIRTRAQISSAFELIRLTCQSKMGQ